MQFILIMALVCGASVFAIAQHKKPANSPPATGHSPEEWKEFVSKEGGFSVLFPGTPKESPVDDNSSPDRYPMYYVTYKSAITYTVLYIEYPESIEGPGLAKEYMDRALKTELSAAAQTGDRAHLAKEADILFEGHPGRFFQLNFAGNKILRANFVVVRNRFYYIEVVTPAGQPKARGARNDYEQIALSFLNSFHLTQSAV